MAVCQFTNKTKSFGPYLDIAAGTQHFGEWTHNKAGQLVRDTLAYRQVSFSSCSSASLVTGYTSLSTSAFSPIK